MKIAFLADPLDTFKTYKDSTYAMMVEAVKRGHTIYAFEPKDMALESGIVTASVARVTLTGDAKDWYRASPATSMFLSQFDAILLRKDPPFDMEYIYTTYLLELAEAQGARVFNKPQAIRDHNEKLAIAQFSKFTSPTLVTRDAARLRAFHAEHQDVILKPLDGMGGAGIFRVRQDALNLGSIIETLTDNGNRTIMIQRFIPEIVAGDKRVLVIGGKVVPYSLARIPQGSEVRGNLAAGGIGVAQPLTERDREIGEALGPVLAQRGLLLVGLDVIGDYLTEVNVTSPTCFQEIKQQSGFDVAAMFIDALEAALK
ncbi:glutathione synthase [Collimonas sp.]|jgi:glutathione synthase|uniref:glutathione synthase n=1 Tax=Collimonas sp. TaxID=1963772 RepID=UPI0037BF4505